MADDPLAQALVQAVVAGHEIPVNARDIAKIGMVETCAGTSYNIRPRNVGALLLATSASPVSIVVNAGDYTTGSRVSVAQMGAGQVTFVAGPSVTIRTPETLAIAKQYAAATLIKTDVTDEWLLAGYLEAA